MPHEPEDTVAAVVAILGGRGGGKPPHHLSGKDPKLLMKEGLESSVNT